MYTYSPVIFLEFPSSFFPFSFSFSWPFLPLLLPSSLSSSHPPSPPLFSQIQQAVKGLSDDSLPVNAVQRAVLFWTFQKGAHSARVKEVKCDQCTEQEDQFAPIVYRNFQRYTINAPLLW